MERKLFLILISIIISLTSFSQEDKRYIRMGNKHYEKERYTEAEVEYLRALTKDSSSYNAMFNLGATLYKGDRFAEAEQLLQKVVSADSVSKHFPAAAYNLGNAFLKQRKLEQAIEAYKSSLLVNPTDTLAKKNLAYAQKLLEKDNQQNQDNQDNKDNQDNQDNQQNKEQEQNQDNKDNQQNQDNKDNQQNQGNQPQNDKMSKEQAEQLLNAIQKTEDKTQEKVNEEKAIGVAGKSGKNW